MVTVIAVLYGLLILNTIVKIFRYVRNPAKTFSWILVVIFFPVIGFLLYGLIGRSPRKDKFLRRSSPFYNSIDNIIIPELLPKSQYRLIELLRQNKSAAISYSNKVTILKDGPETFEHLFASMRSSKESIHLDYYIVESGTMLDEYISIFKDRIAHGVKVRLIYDGFGTYAIDKKYIRQLKEIGVECHEFFPFHIFKLFKYINYRNHRKIVIVDNKIAFTGGMNISDKYLEGDKTLGLWRDTFVKIEGPAASDFEHIFQSDWRYANGTPYSLVNMIKTKGSAGCPVQVIASGPDSEYQGIMQEYFRIITDAQEYVFIVTPYFVPGEAIMTALKTSAMSGIDIQLMFPYDSDSKWMKWAMFSYLEELLAVGIRIFLFHDGFLHGKVIISDDIVSSIGTANVDERSFEANFEVNAIIYNRETAITLKKQFIGDMSFCEELSLAKFPHRSDRNKIMEPIARLTASVL